jgi:hypothetical protein
MPEPLKSMSLLLKAKHWAKFMVLPPLIVTSNNIQVNNFVLFCFVFFNHFDFLFFFCGSVVLEFEVDLSRVSI